MTSRALGIPATWIHISETATDKVPNTGATAASSGSDLNGMAIIVSYIKTVLCRAYFISARTMANALTEFRKLYFTNIIFINQNDHIDCC